MKTGEEQIAPITYSSLWLSRIKKIIPEELGINFQNAHTTAHGAAAYFTDPVGGQRYRITVEPIKGSQEPNFGEP